MPVLYICAKSVVAEMSADGKPAHGRTRILTDFARKRNRKEVLVNYNKTKINIGHQHDRWMEYEGNIESANSCLKWKHRCHWACSSEIGTYIINDSGR